MKFPMFKVGIETSSAVQEIARVLESGYVNEGLQVTEFKIDLERFLGVSNLVLMNSCTSALTIAYKLAGVEPGTEVITSPMTCIATNTPIHNLGGEIVWCDINPDTGNIDPNKIEALITPKTKAIAYVDWAGNPAELEKIWEIGKRNGVRVVQDAAHAFGATWNGESIAKYADFTCFSFQAIKHLSCGDGGALVCNNENDYKLARKLKWFGYDREATKDEKGEWKGQRWEADIDQGEIGFKFNMNNISAAIGLSSLSKVGQYISSHRRNAQVYSDEFSGMEHLRPLELPINANSSYWVFTTILSQNFILLRNTLLEALNDLGIGAGLVHLPNDIYSAFPKSPITLEGVRSFEARQVSLPCGWWISEERFAI